MSRPRLVVAALACALASGSVACKIAVTPESLSRTYHAFKDAKKDLTPANEYFVGRSVATNLLARNGYKYIAFDDTSNPEQHAATAYINAVGNYLALASLDLAGADDREAPIGGWHFVVLDDDKINAFAAPGGFVFVTKGAIELADNEDELAAVLAHEVAHVRRGHALGSIKKSRMAGAYKEAFDANVTLDAAALGDLTERFNGAMTEMLDSILVKGYSRETEYEADKLGLQIMAHAGYDPRAFTTFLAKLDAHQDTGGGGMSATHPKASDRLARLATQLQGMAVVTITAARTQRFEAARDAL